MSLKRIIRRYRLWRWDCENADVLGLAVRMQTLNLGHGTPSPRLEIIIDRLNRQRARIDMPKEEAK